MAMEFWGVEVKAGEPIKVEHSDGILLHLSQASLGEVKKDKANESAVLYVNVDGKKLVIGTLSADKCPQISYDLVFEKEVELSHSWKHGSVYFCGYRAEMPEESDDEGMFDSESESEEEEEVPVAVPVNGKPESKADKSKALADKSKAAKPDNSKVKNAKPDDESEDDDSDEKDDDSEEDGSDDEDMLAGDESDDDDDEESSDKEEEDTPKNAKQNKKRPAVQPATKTPADKKAKLVTPQKSGGDGKKGNTHTSTPHPSKGGKTNTKADKSKQSPKSGSQVSCKACSKTFNSDGALQSHTKAKHSDSK